MSEKIVFLGNCHGNALSIFYREHVAPLRGQAVSFVHAGGLRLEESGAILREADVIVIQKMWFPVDIASENLKPNARQYEIPTIGCRFLWPFANRAHPRNSTFPFCPFGPYGHDLGDSYLNSMIDAQEPAEDAVRKYLELDIVQESNLDRLFEMCIEAYRRMDAQTDFALADFVEKNFRDEVLFMTPGHLSRNMFAELAKQVFQRLDVPAALVQKTLAALRISPFGVNQRPIHPGVIDHFGLKYVDANSRYPYFDEGSFSFSEWAARYLSYDWNQELAEGIALSDGSDPVRTLELLERALQRTPNSFRYLLCQANALLRVGRVDEAEACARKAMQIEPEAPEGPRTLSGILSRRGDREAAESAARHAIALFPADASSHYSLASLLAHRGDMDGAVQSARESATLRPGNSHLHAALGSMLLRSGDFAGAEQAYRKAAELDASVPTFRSGLIEALIQQGKREPALALLRELVAESIPDPKMYWSLGQLLMESGELSGAEQAFRKAVDLDSTTPNLIAALGEVLIRQGKRQEGFAVPSQLAAKLIRQGKHEEALAVLRTLAENGATDPPTYARNQIEIWFSILSGQSLSGASFQTVEQLKTHIDSFIANYNEDARPFASTKSKVPQKRLKPGFSREWKEALWARFCTTAPGRQRQSVERYSIVKRA